MTDRFNPLRTLTKLLGMCFIAFTLNACVAAEIVGTAVDVTTGVVGTAVDVTTGAVDMVIPDSDDDDEGKD